MVVPFIDRPEDGREEDVQKDEWRVYVYIVTVREWGILFLVDNYDDDDVKIIENEGVVAKGIPLWKPILIG